MWKFRLHIISLLMTMVSATVDKNMIFCSTAFLTLANSYVPDLQWSIRTADRNLIDSAFKTSGSHTLRARPPFQPQHQNPSHPSPKEPHKIARIPAWPSSAARALHLCQAFSCDRKSLQSSSLTCLVDHVLFPASCSLLIVCLDGESWTTRG